MTRAMAIYAAFCHGLSRLLLAASLLALAVITLVLAAQVIFRFVLDLPLTHTDEIAQNTSVWLTFLGGAFLYRERGHIQVDLLVQMLRPRLAGAIAAGVELLIAAALLVIIDQIFVLRPLMMRVTYGTLPLSKFTLHFLPLLICATCTGLFAIESFLENLRRAIRPT